MSFMSLKMEYFLYTAILQVDSNMEESILVKWYKGNITKDNETNSLQTSTKTEIKINSVESSLTLTNITKEDESAYMCHIQLPSNIPSKSNDRNLTLIHSLTVNTLDIRNSVWPPGERVVLGDNTGRSQIELVLIIVMGTLILITIVIIFVIRLNPKARARVEVKVVPNAVFYPMDEEMSMLSAPSTTGFEDDCNFADGQYRSYD